MKKFMCIFLVIICVFCLAACSQDIRQDSVAVGDQIANETIEKNQSTTPTDTNLDENIVTTMPTTNSENKNSDIETKLPLTSEPEIEHLPKTDDMFEIYAKVIEIHNSKLLVTPVSVAETSSFNKIYVSTVNVSLPDDIKVGDYIRITYDGYVKETYPAKITTVYEIIKCTLEDIEILPEHVSPLHTNNNDLEQDF